MFPDTQINFCFSINISIFQCPTVGMTPNYCIGKDKADAERRCSPIFSNAFDSCTASEVIHVMATVSSFLNL